MNFLWLVGNADLNEILIKIHNICCKKMYNVKKMSSENMATLFLVYKGDTTWD